MAHENSGDAWRPRQIPFRGRAHWQASEVIRFRNLFFSGELPSLSAHSQGMAKSLQNQIISRALEIISDETHWTRLVLACDLDGAPCNYLDATATRFCAMGALYRAARECLGVYSFAGGAAKHVLAANNRPQECLPRINDAEGHAVIVAMFERALAH